MGLGEKVGIVVVVILLGMILVVAFASDAGASARASDLEVIKSNAVSACVEGMPLTATAIFCPKNHLLTIVVELPKIRQRFGLHPWKTAVDTAKLFDDQGYVLELGYEDGPLLVVSPATNSWRDPGNSLNAKIR